MTPRLRVTGLLQITFPSWLASPSPPPLQSAWISGRWASTQVTECLCNLWNQVSMNSIKSSVAKQWIQLNVLYPNTVKTGNQIRFVSAAAADVRSFISNFKCQKGPPKLNFFLALVLDMIFLGTVLAGLGFLFFGKVSFVKHSSGHSQPLHPCAWASTLQKGIISVQLRPSPGHRTSLHLHSFSCCTILPNGVVLVQPGCLHSCWTCSATAKASRLLPSPKGSLQVGQSSSGVNKCSKQGPNRSSLSEFALISDFVSVSMADLWQTSKSFSKSVN